MFKTNAVELIGQGFLFRLVSVTCCVPSTGLAKEFGVRGYPAILMCVPHLLVVSNFNCVFHNQDNDMSECCCYKLRLKFVPVVRWKKDVKYNYPGPRTRDGIMDFANRVGG